MKHILVTVVSLFVAAHIAEPKLAMAAAKPPAVVVLQCIKSGGSPGTIVFAVDAIETIERLQP
jgi:hypothetical protein